MNLEKEKGASFYRRAWRRFKKNTLGLIGLAMISLLIFIAIIAPVISPYDPNDYSLRGIWAPPSSQHLLGQDELGRDILSRLIWGSRITLQVGFLSIFIMLIIGVPLGAIAGYFGGTIDIIIMRFTDVLLSLPTIFLLILTVSILKARGIYTIIMIIGLLRWPTLARITRAEFLSLKERPFIEAAVSYGAKSPRIIFRHILPNIFPTIITTSTFNLASSILSETALSFLGLGDPTVVSWGKMLSRATEALRIAWLGTAAPGFAIFCTVLAFNLFGDGLRDSFDIKT